MGNSHCRNRSRPSLPVLLVFALSHVFVASLTVRRTRTCLVAGAASWEKQVGQAHRVEILERSASHLPL